MEEVPKLGDVITVRTRTPNGSESEVIVTTLYHTLDFTYVNWRSVRTMGGSYETRYDIKIPTK